ncbi:MAG: hypothetical protein L7F77_15120 [Candidatus Magnetominusculus sp. LBB02]|nr:hypothetical protein [Candidatus Magnetominusculus sp. LBB02]
MKGLSILLTTCLLAVMGLVTAVCSGAEQPAAAEPEKLFEATCSQCHPLSRPKGLRKAPLAWKDTVMKMKNVNGAKFTDEEAEIIINYLSEKYHLPL